MTDNILSPFFLTNFNNYHLNNHFDSFITFSLNNNLIINNNFTNNNNSTTFFSSIYFTAIYSGLLAGIVAITITILIEKLGSTLGALIGTIPTVVVFSVLGCSLDTQRKFPNDFEMKKVTMVEQLFSVPIGMFVTLIYLLCWKFFPPKIEPFITYLKTKFTTLQNTNHVRKIQMLKGLIICFLSLTIWSLFALLIIFLLNTFVKKNYYLLILSGISFYLLSLLLGVVNGWNLNLKKEAPKRKVQWYIILARGALAFSIIFICVLLGGLELNILSGLLTSFPSIYTTTLITIWFSQGEEVVMNSIGSMLLGSASVGLFAMLSCITILYWNILAGMIFSYNFAVLLITLPSFYYLRWRKEVALERNRLLLLAEEEEGKVNMVVDVDNKEEKVGNNMVIDRKEEQVKGDVAMDSVDLKLMHNALYNDHLQQDKEKELYAAILK